LPDKKVAEQTHSIYKQVDASKPFHFSNFRTIMVPKGLKKQPCRCKIELVDV